MVDDNCFSGACPNPVDDDSLISLAHGGGGEEMNSLIKEIRSVLGSPGSWSGSGDDSAFLSLSDSSVSSLGDKLVFTSDSYTVSPHFFPGGNIGDLAFCGTVNDLSVMGAEPLGISLSLVLEEGLPKRFLFDVLRSVSVHANSLGVPVVTGDTKVMPVGAVDELVINTAGVGLVNDPLVIPLAPGDKVVVSRGVAEHGASLLAKRYSLDSSLSSDVKPLLPELRAVRSFVKQAKDLTRGGLSAALNELALKNGVEIVVDDELVPMRKEVRVLSNVLGIDPLSLASEGCFVCVVSSENADDVVSLLKEFNPLASVIGEVSSSSNPRVVLKTLFGKRLLPSPKGSIVPRIC